MLRYKTKARPGLVALYDFRPGNGAGQFLQPQSPHGAIGAVCWESKTRMMGLPGRQRSLTISSKSRVDTMHQRDRRTETDTGRQQRPRLRIALRGKYR